MYSLHENAITAEWFSAFTFAISYLLRVYSSPSPLKYIKSFFKIAERDWKIEN